MGAALLVGALTGLFGVGGGFLIIPALVVLLGVPMATAVGTSLPIIVANCGAALISLQSTQIDWRISAAVASTAVPVAVLAGFLGSRRESRSLQKGFAYLTLTVAGLVLIDTFRS